MESYIGETVLVSLRDPPDTQVRGLVSGIVDLQLCLKDVTWLPSQHRMEIFVVDGPGNILDLEILPSSHVDAADPTSLIKPDIDPAILSYVKPPTNSVESKPSESFEPQNKVVTNATKEQHSPLHIVTAVSTNTKQLPQNTSATLTGPFDDWALSGHLKPGENGLTEGKEAQAQDDGQIKGKNRRRGKGRNAKDRSADAAEQLPAGMKTKQVGPGQTSGINGKQRRSKGNGWRETPILQENVRPKPRLPQTRNGLEAEKPSRRHLKRLQLSEMEQNGWATEDATDIQEMGDFDFSGNLSKFDKRGVFDQLKQEDTTADEERLVSFNRLPPRPGTAGGKNLHYTENVLNSPKPESNRAWSSGDSEADGSKAKLSSGHNSRRNMSRTSARQLPSRKGSAVVLDPQMPGSGSLPEPLARSRWASRGPSNSTKSHRDFSSSRDTTTTALPTSAQFRPSFRIVPSDLPCPSLTPLQMLELEQLAISELGMTEELITENASRSVAETVHSLLLSECSKNDLVPTVVVLAGNTKSGARAIAGARQLLDHGARVIVALLAMDRKVELLDVVQRQINIYKNCGGEITRPDRLGVDNAFKHLPAKPDMVIDAMLGMHVSFEDLGTYGQERYFELAHWVNKGSYVLSIDVPSGLDASSGLPSVADGTDLVIRSNAVLSLGAPKSGVLSALSKGGHASLFKAFVADIGISKHAWRKLGTRNKHGIDFGSRWVIELRCQAGIEPSFTS